MLCAYPLEFAVVLPFKVLDSAIPVVGRVERFLYFSPYINYLPVL